MAIKYQMYKLCIVAGLLLGFLFLSVPESFSQSKEKIPASAKETTRSAIHLRDSLRRRLNKSDTSTNSLLQRVAEYTTTFNQISNSLSNGLDTADISLQICDIQTRITEIKNLANTHRSSTLRYLFVLRDNLDHLQEQLETWQNELALINSKLVQNENEIHRFTEDSLQKANPHDSLLKKNFDVRKKAVMSLQHDVDQTNSKALLKIGLLEDKVAEAYITVLDETDQIDAKIKRFGIRALSSEYSYIWDMKPEYNNLKYALGGTLALNETEFRLFIGNAMFVHILGLCFFILIFIWLNFYRRRAFKTFEKPESVFNQAVYILKHPIISPLLVGSVIVPFFYDHPPVVFLEALFLFSILFVLLLIKENFPRSVFNFLHQLFWITLIYSISNLFIEVSNTDRIAILLLAIFSIVTSLLFLNKLKHGTAGHLPYSKAALRVFLTLQVLSLICNITGRFSLAKIIGVTAVYNLWLLLCLYFVIQIILQGLFLQVEVKKTKNAISSWLDYNLLQKKFRKILTTIAAGLWLFMLLQNLNIEDWARDYVTDILNQSRTVGGASFTFGGFIIFISVIWLSSVASKIISYIYDVSGRQGNNLSALKKKNHTSTLLIRLSVLAVGFLLAVAASGFPLDKITIIISAFGIGIGFGLQNIVNNLVSGVILAFEKPVQIGDIIEVDSRSGVITDIGIRSSRIATYDGSEVIVPNGDLISHHVINWTLSNNNRRVELIVSVAYGSDIEKVKTLLQDLLCNRGDVMTDPAPAVFLHSLSQSTVDFKILFWAADISTWVGLKSNILGDIYAIFKREDIKIPFPQSDVHVYFPEKNIGDAGINNSDTKDESSETDSNKKD